MHISITGDLGSGKSTVAKEICRLLGYSFLSTGAIQRKLGLEKGMNTLEFNKFTDQNKQIDDYIDQHLKDIDKGTEPYVLDSRLAWFFVKKSFKVYLLAFDRVAAERILADKNRIGEPEANDVFKKIQDTKERRIIENNRFHKNYGVEFDIYKNFDLVVDTSNATPDQVVETLLTAYKLWADKNEYTKLWFSNKRIYPLQPPPSPVVHEDLSENIGVILHKGQFFLYDDSEKLATALANNMALIPVSLMGRDSDILAEDKTVATFVEGEYKLQEVHDWESAFGFTYYDYPSI